MIEMADDKYRLYYCMGRRIVVNSDFLWLLHLTSDQCVALLSMRKGLLIR
jgi:hypothetical protein